MPKHTRIRVDPCFFLGGEVWELTLPLLQPVPIHPGTSQLLFPLRDGRGEAELNLRRASPLSITSHLISFGKGSDRRWLQLGMGPERVAVAE